MFSKPSHGFLYSISGSFLWAVAIVNNRYILNAGEDPLNYVFWLGLLNFPLWIYLFSKHTKEFIKLRKKDYFVLVFIGVASAIGLNFLQALALKNTTAVNFSFLYRMIIVFTFVLAWIFFKEKLTLKKIFLGIIILLGSFLLTTKGQALVFTRGDIYTLLMALSAAFIGNILVKHTVSKMHVDLSASFTMIISFICILLFSFLSGIIRVPSQLFLIFLGSLIVFFQLRLRNRAYRHGTASFVTMIYSFTPVFVSLISFPLLGERLDAIQIIGGIFIVGSGVLAEKFKI